MTLKVESEFLVLLSARCGSLPSASSGPFSLNCDHIGGVVMCYVWAELQAGRVLLVGCADGGSPAEAFVYFSYIHVTLNNSLFFSVLNKYT